MHTYYVSHSLDDTNKSVNCKHTIQLTLSLIEWIYHVCNVTLHICIAIRARESFHFHRIESEHCAIERCISTCQLLHSRTRSEHTKSLQIENCHIGVSSISSASLESAPRDEPSDGEGMRQIAQNYYLIQSRWMWSPCSTFNRREHLPVYAGIIYHFNSRAIAMQSAYANVRVCVAAIRTVDVWAVAQSKSQRRVPSVPASPPRDDIILIKSGWTR